MRAGLSTAQRIRRGGSQDDRAVHYNDVRRGLFIPALSLQRAVRGSYGELDKRLADPPNNPYVRAGNP
jgi:hypothetical protein